jgi:transposase
MSAPKNLIVKESLIDLKKELKQASSLIAPRIKMLIEIKKSDSVGISKRYLAQLIGVNHNSIQTWRTMYQQGGLVLLKSHKKTGFRPSVLNETEHKQLAAKLNDPSNGLTGYKELLEWVKLEMNKDIKYNTLLKYCVRNFKSSSKVARKSHIKKDELLVEAFKKTLLKPVKTSLKKRNINLQK